MKRIAVLTSGGDCSGMNAAIRAVVRAALAEGLEVVGVQKGYHGLIDNHFQPLDTRSVSNMLQRGGTFLQSARCREMYEEPGQQLAAENLAALGVQGLVVIGGDGSLRGALALTRRGMPVIGIPASIDNDIPFTDMSLGVDTALNNIIYAVDCLKDTASSHDRAFVVETMGRNCGYLAVAAAIASGAEVTLLPEAPYDIAEVCSHLRRRFDEGRSNSIIMVAEGAGNGQKIAEQIKDAIGFETRVMILGHYQRGGSPSAFDRILAARFGVGAVEALLAGERGKMLGLAAGGLKLTPLEQVIEAGKRPIDQIMLSLSQVLGI
ncbi:6-phosphofructokinase [Desulfuromonas versatilis]|uniref:6-phosphofructokinase n=1 Tax=Desulfuromonas versatilis TaxID=2802975 RepID=UPI001C84585C